MIKNLSVLQEPQETLSIIIAWRIPADREVWGATVYGVTVRQDWECTYSLRGKGESEMQKQSQSLENMLNKSVLRNHLLGGWQTFLVKGQQIF